MTFTLTPLVLSDRNTWREWLTGHHQSQKEIWLIIRRAGSPDPGLRLGEAVEEALCFGWIDSQMKPIDENSYALRFSPRHRKSVWAESNIKRVRKLLKEGKMTPDGLAIIPEHIKEILEET